MKGKAADIENLVDMLNRLVDPVEPAPIPLTPQTAGWWVLAVILAVIFTAGWWFARRRWKRGAYRRAALSELNMAGDDPAAIAGILRRVSLVAYPRRAVASLTGEEWLTFLQKNGRFPDSGQELLKAPYSGAAANTNDLRQAVRVWIQTHRAAP